MTDIYLIRHGQGSFGADNYDQLSPLGERQCQLLGEHLSACDQRFDAVYSGPLQRQLQSCHFAGTGAGGHGEPDEVLPALKEYDAREIFTAYLPTLLAADEMLASNQEQLYSDRKLFQRALSGVMQAWTEDTCEREDCESWQNFCGRVGQTLDALIERHGSRDRLALHTSGGVISVALLHVMGIDARTAIAMSWQVLNSSVTRLHYGRKGYTLAGFNNIAHLELQADPGLITYR